MSTPKRYPTTERNVGGWAYEDGEQMAFAMACQNENFGLAAFDDFLDTLTASPLRDELLRWRTEAFELHQSGNRKALHWCLQAIWIVMKSEFTIDGIHPMLEMSMNYSEEQSWKGKRGAEKRWTKDEAHTTVMDMIETLSKRSDELGDPIPPSDLWPELYAMMDKAGLNPIENRDYSYNYTGAEKPLNYEAFRKQVRRNRK